MPEAVPPPRLAVIPNEGSTLAGIVYWARYKSFWFGAISRIATFNGAVGLLLWAIDEATNRQNPTLLAIRSNLPLTIFVATLIALAYTAVRLGLKLDPQQPLANAPLLVVMVLVIVAVTSIAGPVFVAIGEAGLLVASSIILLGGLGAGVATGQLLETRISVERLDDIGRLVLLMLGLSLYFFEERRHWQAQPPTPAVVERLQRACKLNDFALIHRWLGEDLVFSQSDQRLLAGLILPRRMVVDGDLAGVAAPSGEFVLFRVRKGQVVDMRVYEKRGDAR